MNPRLFGIKHEIWVNHSITHWLLEPPAVIHSFFCIWRQKLTHHVCFVQL
jgi:hypothetical protein